MTEPRSTKQRPRREPRVRRRVPGRGTLVAFALGGGVLYLAGILALTLAVEDLPTAGWIGFGVVGAVVLAVSTVLAVFLVRASRAAGSEPPLRRRVTSGDGRRVLVLADESCSGDALSECLARRLAGRDAEVLVVAPALVSAVRYLDSDVDAARAAAQARLQETLGSLRAAGIGARGAVGSESPLEALADALATFSADEIVVATPPAERANWLEQRVVERARALYTTPVEHLVVEARPRRVERPR